MDETRTVILTSGEAIGPGDVVIIRPSLPGLRKRGQKTARVLSVKGALVRVEILTKSGAPDRRVGMNRDGRVTVPVAWIYRKVDGVGKR